MVYAIILSGGIGTRFGNQLPKQFLKINNKTILEYSIETFETHNLINKIIIVSNPNFVEETKEILAKNNYKKVCAIISGGNTIVESAYRGLKQINETENVKDKIKVLINDSVRPNTSNKIISEIIKGFDEFKALSPAIKTTDTIYISNATQIIKSIPNRDNIYKAQTPQGFDFNTIFNAYNKLDDSQKFAFPDDCSVLNFAYPNIEIKIVEGDNKNLKITFPEDLEVFKQLLTQ